MSEVRNGFCVLKYGELKSTNEQAKLLVEAGIKDKIVIRADMQTNGKGRNGRHWQSPRGNLACSIISCPNVQPSRLSELSFVAAVALRRCIAKAVPNGSVKIKWPNDLLVSDSKISGILLEIARGVDSPKTSVIVGVGVNVASAPMNLERPVTFLRAYNNNITCDELFSELIENFIEIEKQWICLGLGPILTEWLDYAVGLGQKITVRKGDSELEGVFESLDKHGALMLRGADGKIDKISAGDIFLG